jgi:hypothetical protein
VEVLSWARGLGKNTIHLEATGRSGWPWRSIENTKRSKLTAAFADLDMIPFEINLARSSAIMMGQALGPRSF